MKKSMIALTIAASLVSLQSLATPTPHGFPSADAQEVYLQMDQENLVRAYNDLHPEAAFMSLWNAYFDEGSTQQNVGIMETSVDARQLVLTANSETLYAVHPVDLDAQGGAVVVEIPAKVLGMVNGVGWTASADLGIFGPDQGKGGKYLITSPSYQGEIPEEYYHAPAPSNTIVWLLRAFVENNDMQAAVKHLQDGVKTYSLADANNPPATTFYNTSESTTVGGKNMDMLYDKSEVFDLIKQYFEKNNGGHEKHIHIRGHLDAMGFFTESVSSELLTKAAEIGDQRQRTQTFNNRAEDALKWPGKSSWQWANNFSDEHYTGRTSKRYTPDQHQVWAHQATFTSAAMTRPPKGIGSQYITATKDQQGEWLNGSKHCTLVIPADVPAANFWSVIAYDAETRSMIQNQDFQWGVNSYAKDLTMNKDGSATLHFSPKQPKGVSDRNWIQTKNNDGYFLWFRTYAPTDTWYDNSWVLPDLSCK